MASAPEEYLCPINLTLMSDPVIGSDGRSYERSAITQWLRSNPHSPITRQPMTIGSLKPNYALKTAIERYNASVRQPRPMASAPPADDLYYAIQVYQEDVHAQQQRLLAAQQQPALRYGPTTVIVPQPQAGNSPEERRKRALFTCVCVAFAIVLAIIISRVVISIDN